MSKAKQNKTVKLEGASHDAAFVSGQSLSNWLKHGKERYYHTIGNKTATSEQQEAMLTKVYELAHKAMGTEPKKQKTEEQK